MKVNNAIQVTLTVDEIDTILSNHIKRELKEVQCTDIDKTFNFNYNINAARVISGDENVIETRLLGVTATWKEGK